MNPELTLETVKPSVSFPRERRSAVRVPMQERVLVHLGRTDGVLVDYSGGGARIRHAAALGVRTRVRVSFQIGVAQFHGTALILSCRFTPGAAPGQCFESRVSFLDVDYAMEPRLQIAK